MKIMTNVYPESDSILIQHPTVHGSRPQHLKICGMVSERTSSVYSFSKYTEEPEQLTAHYRGLSHQPQHKYREQASL